jgi:hypothetical protein
MCPETFKVWVIAKRILAWPIQLSMSRTRRFGGSYRRRVSRWQAPPAYSMFAELFFDPEYGGDTNHRNVGATQRTTWHHIPEDDTLHNHRCENLKCYYSIVIHCSRAVRDVLSNTYHDRWIGRGGHTAWPPRSPDLNPLYFYLWGHLNTRVYAAPVDTSPSHCGCLSEYPQLPRHLWTDEAVHGETYWGMHWISWRVLPSGMWRHIVVW